MTLCHCGGPSGTLALGGGLGGRLSSRALTHCGSSIWRESVTQRNCSNCHCHG